MNEEKQNFAFYIQVRTGPTNAATGRCRTIDVGADLLCGERPGIGVVVRSSYVLFLYDVPAGSGPVKVRGRALCDPSTRRMGNSITHLFIV